MKTRITLMILAASILGVGGTIVWANSGDESGSEVTIIGDPIPGKALYAENCASCHGVNLEGQGDWRSPGSDGRLPAPPHDKDGHTWHHPDSLLFTYTKLGGKETLAASGMDFDSGMPGFAEQLSDQEIWDTLAFIKSQWSDRIRAIQAERTAADTASKGN